MSPKSIMFMGLVLAVGTIISLTFGGQWLGSSEVSIQDALTVFTQAKILGIWSVTVPNITFFLVGAKSMMTLDFAFFGGVLGMVQWIFMLVFVSAFMWGIYSVMIYVISGLFKR